MTSTRAAIYTRISLDTEGRALGVARQQDDCQALAERLGLDVVETFTDNDMGASTRSRTKVRPAYRRMLEGAQRGDFGTILAYSNSRLTRRPMEFEELIALHERHGVRIATAVSGEDDLSTADGRMVARIKASIDAGEAERTAERVARVHLEHAKTGRPVGGRRPFGWLDDKATPHPTEAALIREAVDDALAGVSVTRIAKRWTDAGITTTSSANHEGRTWKAAVLKRTLLSPRLAGWRIHQGKVLLDGSGAPVRGMWEPLITVEQHEALKRALARPERRTRIPRRGARHYLLTGVLRCGVCNGVMYGNRTQWGHTYACQNPEHPVNTGSGSRIDEIVSAMALLRLQEIDLDAAPVPSAGPQVRLDEIAGQIAELMAAFTSRRLSGAVVFDAVGKLEAERDALLAVRETVAATRLGPKLTRLDPDAWASLDTDRQRAILEQLLDAVLLRPATRRGNHFDAGRLEPVWRAAR